LKNNLVLKASDVVIVVEWWSAPRWNFLEMYLSIRLTLLGCSVDGDEAFLGARLLVAATIWNLLDPTQGD
jgi:hypothetical protein